MSFKSTPIALTQKADQNSHPDNASLAGNPVQPAPPVSQDGPQDSPRTEELLERIRDRAETAERLRQSEALLAQAEQLADIGSWELDYETLTLAWSAHFYRMLGIEPRKGPVPYGYGMRMIHPDDRDRAMRDAEALREGRSLDNELRFVRADGSLRFFHSRAIPIADETGRIARVRGMSQDITDRRQAEERLRESEALLADAEQIAHFGSWEFDLQTRKVTLSKHLRQMYGIAPDAGWTEEMYWTRVHHKDRERAQQLSDRMLAEGKPWDYVARYVPPEGGARVHFTRGVPILGADGKPVRTIGVIQDITEQTRAEEELRRLSHQLMQTRDEDRRHMARELHESAGQSLAALKMTLGRLREVLPKKTGSAQEFLHSAIELAEGAIREVRTVSYLMHPPLLDEAGLGPALRWYASGFAERSGIQVSVEIPDDLARQSQEVETTVFRIVQEALTNVHRYSGSRNAGICVVQQDGKICAEVRDDGCGLVPPNPSSNWQAPPGVGISGMRERVQQLNGVFELESAPGQGTTIRAILPTTPALSQGLTSPEEGKYYHGNDRRKARPASA